MVGAGELRSPESLPGPSSSVSPFLLYCLSPSLSCGPCPPVCLLSREVYWSPQRTHGPLLWWGLRHSVRVDQRKGQIPASTLTMRPSRRKIWASGVSRKSFLMKAREDLRASPWTPLGHSPLLQTLGAKPLLLHILMPQEHGQPGISQSIVSWSLPTYYPPPPHVSLSPTPSPSSFLLSPSTSSSLLPQEMKSCYMHYLKKV